MERKFSSDGIRTHACLRTEDLKSPPLDLAPALMNGDSDGGRTRNLQLRRLVHYPIVLQSQGKSKAFLFLERLELSASD